MNYNHGESKICVLLQKDALSFSLKKTEQSEKCDALSTKVSSRKKSNQSSLKVKKVAALLDPQFGSSI